MIAPVLNFINSNSETVINSWYEILADLCRHPEFVDQFSRLERLDLLLGRAIKNASVDVNWSLMSFLNTIATHDLVKQAIITVPNVKPFVHQLGIYCSKGYADLDSALLVYLGKSPEESAAMRHNKDYEKAYGMMVREVFNNQGVMAALAASLKHKDPGTVYATMQALEGMVEVFVPTR